MKFKNPLSPEEYERQLAELAALTDDDIDTSDIPPLPDSFFENAVRGKFYRPKKEVTTVRLDTDIKEWLKAKGRGYQTRLNEILREAMLAELHPKPKRKRAA
jgi:uncharacterized protein (DUF4415 family)